MTKTAMQILRDELTNTIELENNPMMNDERRLMLRVIQIFIDDENLIEVEKNQIIEAALNFSNDKSSAEQYYSVTYGG